MTAHTEAYDRTQILHRDVSAGNILITDEGSGILIDWDLSKKVVRDGSAKQRQHSRTVRHHVDSIHYQSMNIALRGHGNSYP